jgi:hypothetical protein
MVIPYTAIPEQVMTEPIVRGTQVGYNICNSTTQNQQSECQTAFINNIYDFCFWGPPVSNTPIADSEGYEVAWCTTKKHGTRLIPQGTLTGVQVLNNSNYIQIVAFINQVNVNLPANDTGGELDPHGQDLSGNPQGGLVYSTAFSSDGVTIQQLQEWNMFIGSNVSAIKGCNGNGTTAEAFCLNTLDRLGTAYNMPNNAQNGVFEVCDSDAMQLPGVYVSNGQTLTYTQPPESLGPITTVPYTPVVPSSSNCQTYQSTDLYTDTLPTSAVTGATPTPSGKSGSSGTRTGSGNPSTSTSGSNDAGVVTISLFSTILGVAFSVAFLA